MLDLQLSAFFSRVIRLGTLGFALIMCAGLIVATVRGTGKALYRAATGNAWAETAPSMKAVRR